jgi:undecaprenyl-diphosphatase
LLYRNGPYYGTLVSLIQEASIMDYTLVFLQAVVQGITEFLPISSDGHLTVVGALHQEVTGQSAPEPMRLTIVLHAGTLMSILVFYWRRIVRLLNEDRRVLGLMIVGTLPAVVLGLPARLWADDMLTDPLLAGALLTVTGLMLVWAARQPPGEVPYQRLTYGQALLIGVFQGIAILPGISRSGSTIAAGLALGMRRDAAATFSFLLAIPTIAGACAVETVLALRSADSQQEPPVLLAAGAVASMLVGLFALWWVVRWLERGRLQYFAWWCIPVGLAVVVWQLGMGPG